MADRNATVRDFLNAMLGREPETYPRPAAITNAAGVALPGFDSSELTPTPAQMTLVQQPDGRLSQYPPADKWDDWVEWDGKAWPQRVARRYMLIPTICFNCESACGLLAYVDRTTLEVKKFEGNPAHPGSRGRNCAKGPATINQTYDPERILHPLKRVGERGGGQWKQITWDEALDEIAARMRASRERGATASCITWGARARMATPSASSARGAWTVTTRTPTSARQGRAQAMRSGAALTAPAPITPTHA